MGDVESMPYVASIIYNRADGDVAKMAGVITKIKQFSCWNKMSTDELQPEKFKFKNLKYKYDSAGKITGVNNDVSAKLAQRIAEEMVNGNFRPVLSPEYTHYHATSMKSPPEWTKSMKGVKKGHHIFYK